MLFRSRVVYGIDKRADEIESGIIVFSPQDILPAVDVIINTTVYDNMDIIKCISSPPTDIIISISDVIKELKQSKK